jgi:hypothetical protein
VEALLAQEPQVERFLESRPWPGESVPGQAVAEADDETVLEAPPVDEEGLFADRYRVLKMLGQGGMGVVYQAEDVRLKRFVALKFLTAALSAHAQSRSRFLREAQAAAALDDPHVCTVYEAGEDRGRAYIAMAFIDGPTLRDRIAQGRGWPGSRISAWHAGKTLASPPGRQASPGRRRTCRPSRRRACRRTSAPTSGHSAACSTRC